MAALKYYDILVPGNYFCDIIFSGFPRFPAPGTEVYSRSLTVTIGGVLNTVIALQRLGVNVGWPGQAGSDFFSHFAIETAHREGVDMSLLRYLDTPLQRVTVAISSPQDRAFISYADDATTPVQMVLDGLDSLSFRHLHFTGLERDTRAPDLLDMLHSRGVTISMDCQDNPFTLESPGVREVITRLDFFMPNASEIQRLTGCATVTDAAEVLRQLVPTLVIKDGANGAYLWHGNDVLHSPAYRVVPLDTTGAGDVFNAGFLAGWLEGRSYAECLRWGNICGALSTTGYGGVTAAPSRSLLDEILAAS